MNTGSDFLSRYQRWRPVVEPGFWVAFFGMQAWFNCWIAINAIKTFPFGVSPFQPWQPIVHIGASNLVLLMWVPLVLAFDRRFPLRGEKILSHLLHHFAATIVYSVTHVIAMVALYKASYALLGKKYTLWGWSELLFYQYLKDFRTYFYVLFFVYFYRLMLLRLQGEASLLAAPDTGPPMEPVERPEHFLVKKRGREFLLPATDIEWIQACGNYVNLRVRGHDYMLRSTMNAIEARLDPKRFVRVHRSYIANLAHLLQIEPLESGDARARMADKSEVPVSRRYLDQLRKATTA